MTEISYLWDGTVTGDASEAPYDRDEFNTFMFMLNSADSVDTRVFVSPTYRNDLRVHSSDTAMSVTVEPGAALMGGRFAFTLDEAVSLAITPIATTGYFRYDYVVLRLQKNEQKIRLAVISGGETASAYALSDPSLVQTPNFKEIPIAKIFVDDSGIVYDKYIYDMREFATNTFSINSYSLSRRNMVHNSEFMVYSDPGGSTVDGWNGLSGATLSTSTKLSKMSRGQSIQFDSNSFGMGVVSLVQTILLDTNDRTFTVKGIIQHVSGAIDGGRIYVELVPCTLYGDVLAGWDHTTAGGSTDRGGVYKRQEYTELIPDQEIEYQFTITFEDNPAMRGVLLRFGAFHSDGTSVIMNVGQTIVVPGYFPGPFREISETIMLREPLTAVAWSDTAKSTGTTLIDLNAVFGVAEKTKGVYVRLRGRDSGSAAGNASIQVQGYVAPYDAVYGRVELDGVNNDVYRENTFYVPVNAPLVNAQDGTPQLRIGVTATGAGTFDATVEIVGIAT